MGRCSLNDKTIQQICNVIAFLMSCDGFVKHSGDYFTGADVWRSNSRGELCGVLIACQALVKCLPECVTTLPEEILVGIEHTIDGVPVDVKNLPSTGLGQELAKLLWNGI